MAAISEAITQLDAIIAQLRLEMGRGVKKGEGNRRCGRDSVEDP
jgi:hypothetical protein